MTMKPFKELTPRLEALRLIQLNVNPVTKTEKVPLEAAAFRVLAIDVEAGFDVPPFDRSSMDGYAVKAVDTLGATEETPVGLRLVGVEHTGDVHSGSINHGECLEIATGAPMPPGADAVVMVEYTTREGDKVHIKKSIKPGRNMASAGEDMQRGDHVLDAGMLLTPGKVGALAALGYSKVTVYAKPRVAVYSSGPEIVSQGRLLEPGQIYDVNSYTLQAMIEANGGVPVRRGIVADSLESVRNSVRDATGYDLGVFSGGSSVGVKDLFGEVIEEMGTVYFHGVKVKPGKPTLFGRVGDTVIFGMPGYPTSCLNNSYVFLAPALRKAARLPPAEPRILRVPLGHRMETKSDRDQFITVRIEDGKAYRVYKQSGDITSMTHADGVIIIPIGKTVIAEGETVEVTLLESLHSV